ncbi:hypothetical protein FRC09_008694 [Ceratobasidium sp. 395]|nr:hypothetical protein FRC09_008694 [Ceratobasidium sp. 395]
MDPSSQGSAGSRDPAPDSSPEPPRIKQGIKRKTRYRLTDFGTALRKTADVFEFGPWKSALDDIGELTNAIRRVASDREGGETLIEELEELINEVSEHLKGNLSPAAKSSIEDFAKGVRKEIELLRSKRRPNSRTRRLEGALRTDDEAKQCYRRVKILLNRLSVSACFAVLDTVLVATQVNTNASILKTIDEEAMKRLLKTLPDSPSAKYCSTQAESLGRGECTSNTRVELLEQLRTWACDDKAQKIYWLNGMAGTGKTTIAYSLCEYLQSVQKLGASFFCSQRLPECRDVNRIVPSISYRLSLFSVPFRHALASVLEDDEDAYNQPLQKQLDVLFAKPLRETTDTFPANVVIVIDALDECDDQDGVAKVITTLLSHAAGLPVKFFVTSRPEPKIVDQMQKKEAEGVRCELRLHELKSTVVRQDITTYLTAKLAPAALSEAELNILVQRSGVLFIYAATAVRFIEFDSFSGFKQRLQLVLDASAALTNESDEALDELYTTILKTALELKGLTRAEKAARATVLRHVVCAREPLSLDVMAGLLQANNTAQVSTALRPLQSVLSVSESKLIGTLHESFPNYLLNHARSGRFYCDPGLHHAQMAQQCFSLIKVPSPPFNICKLESSYLLDEEVPGIEQRVGEAISQPLAYACRYWAAHLELADHSEDCLQLLYEFLSERLLLWMEVMNLKKQMWEGVYMLRKAQTWCKSKGRVCSNDLLLLVQDAKRFVSVVVSDSVSHSTPHIYISALAFWPKSRPVTKHYLPKFSGLVNVAGTALASHETAPLSLNLSAKKIWKLAYSPDGEHIAFIDEGNDVAMWNIRTGRCEASLGGTQTRFWSIAFSHNGLHVILGCDGGAVRIWDTQTRQMVGDPLKNHNSRWITSVTCSPNGDHIAAGSSDKSVHIWNRSTSQIMATIPGHTGEVRSITYSPDSAYIVSGSVDRTIRIWNARSSQMLGKQPNCHTGAVNSVAFSPDGAHIASGTDDGDIHVWDARTGKRVREPLRGHHASVSSVQYSPSGLYLVSGSYDHTACVWDLSTGRVATQLLSITEPIIWVSYSPGGAQVLACSYSGTLYIWDSSTVEVAAETCFDDPVDAENSKALKTDSDCTLANLDGVDRVKRVGKTHEQTHEPQTVNQSRQGHRSYVSALAYSLDGAYIVSGSYDCTVCIWDVHAGRLVGQPLEGHTKHITSVSFSPNGAYIASSSEDTTVRIWDVGTCTMLGYPLTSHTSGVNSVSYSPDGAHIASGSADETIRIWDAFTGQMMKSLLVRHTNGASSVLYSPDGAFLVSGCSDGGIRIWNTQNGSAVSPMLGHADKVQSVAFSPDSLYFVTCSQNTVYVWDTYTGSRIGEALEFGHDQLHSISYSSAGANLSISHYSSTNAYHFSSPSDKAIHVSHTHVDRDFVHPFRPHHTNSDLTRCVFSPDGTQIASGYRDGTIRVSSIHVRQVLDTEMMSHGNRPCAIVPCTCGGQFLSPSSVALV